MAADRNTTLINKLSTAITTSAPIILDGALATHLDTLGADLTGTLWSASVLLHDPGLIKRAHLDYFRAGANVAITASYQASVSGLMKHSGLNEEDAIACVARSVEIAKQAREEFIEETVASLSGEERAALERIDGIEEYADSVRMQLFIAGSVGPYGAFLADGSEYRGDYKLNHEEMKSFHRGRMDALVKSGVDCFAIETIPSKAETVALLDLLTSEFPDTEAWFSFTLRDSTHVSDGTSLAEIAALFESAPQVVALGFNCVSEDLLPEALGTLGPLMQRGTMVVYPNSGEQWNAQARDWEGQRTEGGDLASKAMQWWNAGAGLVGGCCRTTPDDIRTIVETLRRCR